jgi:cytochrome c-type biogenesis protein CcmH/NrfG
MRERETKRGGWVVLAAVALLAAIGIGVWQRAGHIPGLSAGQPAAGSALAGGAGDWAIDRPAIVTPASGHASVDAGALTAALAPYGREDYASATASLEGFVATHPESPDGWFYLGASRLLSGDAARARPAFDKARVLSAAERPELEWLSATAEARTGAIESARARLEALCALPGPLQVRACAAKESLRPN